MSHIVAGLHPRAQICLCTRVDTRQRRYSGTAVGARRLDPPRCRRRANGDHLVGAPRRSTRSVGCGCTRSRSSHRCRQRRAPAAHQRLASTRTGHCVGRRAHRPGPPGTPRMDTRGRSRPGTSVAALGVVRMTVGARHLGAPGPGGRRVATGAVTSRTATEDVWAASAMALTEALPAIDRLDGRPVSAPRSRGRDPTRVGSPAHRADRPALPRRRGRSRQVTAGSSQ